MRLTLLSPDRASLLFRTLGDGNRGAKQVDRLLSNDKVPCLTLAPPCNAMVVGSRDEILVALD